MYSAICSRRYIANKNTAIGWQESHISHLGYSKYETQTQQTKGSSHSISPVVILILPTSQQLMDDLAILRASLKPELTNEVRAPLCA